MLALTTHGINDTLILMSETTVQRFRTPAYLLNKTQYSRVVRETHNSEDKAEYLAALWETAQRLYPSLCGFPS